MPEQRKFHMRSIERLTTSMGADYEYQERLVMVILVSNRPNRPCGCSNQVCVTHE
jgi:hypothetical protein